MFYTCVGCSVKFTAWYQTILKLEDFVTKLPS